jgi:rhodanese-related sulfurtransferase
MVHKTYAQLVDEARVRVKELTVEQLREMQRRGAGSALVDIREDREWNLGHLPGAVHMSRGTLESKIDGAVPRERPVVLYCANGNRSVLAAESLRQMGYVDVASLAGGVRAWVDSGGEIEG